MIISLVLSAHVNVMMPLTTLNNNGQIKDRNFIVSSLAKLKDAKVAGIMIDVWWGIVEQQPGQYNFDGYYQVFQLAKEAGLHVQPVMSFHRCGGNVGDDCDIPLPKWVHDIAISKRYYYEDHKFQKQEEYISAAADNEKVFPGPSGLRTPLMMYEDYMKAFVTKFRPFIESGLIDDIQVGSGPCGETRYPSYPMNRWKFPGVGEFQAWDPLMVDAFKQYSKAHGKSYDSPPTNAGEYNNRPEHTGFFTKDYYSEYGQFFMEFYQDTLLNHSKIIMDMARNAFPTTQLSLKLSGIHWWYGHDSHAAELTCGYNNLPGRGKNAYEYMMKLFGKSIQYDFTCLEMTNNEQRSANADCKPEELVEQVFDAAKQLGVKLSGENALERYDWGAYGEILRNIRYARGNFQAFTYLRLTGQLMNNGGFYNDFKKFVEEVNKL